MYSLLNGLWTSWTAVPQRKVAVLGLDNAGKSALLECVKAEFPPHSAPIPLASLRPTVGLNLARVDDRSGEQKILLWDLGGRGALRALWTSYLADADALAWVVDSADAERLEESRAALQSALAQLDSASSGGKAAELRGGAAGAPPLLILANKQDHERALDAHCAATRLRLEELLRRPQGDDAATPPTRQMLVAGCSAKDRSGVVESFRWLFLQLKHGGGLPPPPAKAAVKAAVAAKTRERKP